MGTKSATVGFPYSIHFVNNKKLINCDMAERTLLQNSRCIIFNLRLFLLPPRH